MDVVALGLAKSDARARYTTPGHFAHLTTRLQTASEDAVMVVLGDSTQNEVTEWVYLTGQWLADQYPAWTVTYRLWNVAGETYDPAVTIQTGTNGRTLTIYNASAPGEGATYSLTRIRAQIPAAPHVIVVSYGHNDGQAGPAYRGTHYALTRLLEDWFPTAGLVLVNPNPRAPGNAGHANGLSRAQAIIDLAASEDYGLVNVTQAFLDNPAYATELLQGDGIHPTAAGSRLWASCVTQQISRSRLALPKGPRARTHRVWVPATAFMADEGSPTLAVVGPTGARFPAWALDPAVTESVVATADWPDTWLTYNAYVVWSFATGSGYTISNNGVRWEYGRSRPGVATGTPFDSPTSNKSLGVPNNYSSSLAIGAASNSGAWGRTIARVATSDASTYRPLGVRVRRVATDAADNFAEDAYFVGLMLERAS